MNNTSPQPRLGISIGRNALLLATFALACTAIIAGTFLLTADSIEEQKRQARLKALYEIIPREIHDNNLLEDSVDLKLTALGHRGTQTLYLARKNNRPIAVIYPVTARDGYSGDIDMLVGITVNDRSVAGVRVLQHRETPGLGDKIDRRKSSWIDAFRGRSLTNPPTEQWSVKKDGGAFDGFTGATITPRAVINAVRDTLDYHNNHYLTLRNQF